MKTEKFSQSKIKKEDLQYIKGSGYQRFCPLCGALCNIIYMEHGAFQFECPACSYISEVIIL